MAVPDHDPALQVFDRQAEAKLYGKSRAPLDEMPTGTFESSNVHSALYDYGARELYLRFKRDAVDAIYRYDEFDASTWQGLLNASSKGSYVNERIAFSYQYTKVTSSAMPGDTQDLDNDLLRRFLTAP